LINQVIKANIVKDAEESLIELVEKYKIGLLQSKIFSRVVYRSCIKEGKGVVEMFDKKAKEEMEQLMREIANISN
jgi:chromosome partitioning protein